MTENKLQLGNGRKDRRPSLSQYNQKNSKLFEKVGTVVSVYFKSEAFNKRKEVEFEDIVQKLGQNIDAQGPDSNVNFNHFATCLLKYLDPDNESCTPQMTLIGLRI